MTFAGSLNRPRRRPTRPPSCRTAGPQPAAVGVVRPTPLPGCAAWRRPRGAPS